MRPAAFQAAVILKSGCGELGGSIEGGENGSGEFGSVRLPENRELQSREHEHVCLIYKSRAGWSTSPIVNGNKS